MHKRGLLLMIGIISLTVILTGCFKGEQSMDKAIDPPKKTGQAHNADKNNNKAAKKQATKKARNNDEDTVKRQLFLIDANGKVVPQTVKLPQDDSMAVAKQALEYLVKDGPVSNLLPNGFKAVLPPGTDISSVDLQDDGTLVVDVSKDFENYEANDEVNILEAMTYTVTQFDRVKRMKLEINGQSQNKMPVDGTPIANGYSRANGINLQDTDTTDFLGTKPVTLYYPTEFNETEYFVPVTEHVALDDDDAIFRSTINALMKGPGLGINAKQVFNSDVELTADPSLDDGVLDIVFNKEILKNKDKMTISDDVMRTLVRTLTEQADVKAVNVHVDQVDKLFNEDGKAYTEPVTEDMITSTEKL